MRDAFLDGKVMTRCAHDVRMLLLGDQASEEEIDFDTLFLWDDKHTAVDFGVSYGKGYDTDLVAVEESNGTLVGA